MQYIFDFDETLFNVRTFKEDALPYKENGLWVTPGIADILDMKNYVFKDALTFLSQHEKETMKILTFVTHSLGNEAEAFQKVKVTRSGIMDFVTDAVFMEGDKGPYIKQMYTGEATVFVDDKLEHLLSAREHCPEVQVVQMVRPGLEKLLPTDATVPVIASLNELDTIL